MIEVHERDGVRVLELARGKVNALDLELVEALALAFREPSDGAPVVLTGRGSAFSAGVDLARVESGGADYVHRFLPALSEALLAVFEHPAPVVAGLNGHALAGGCILAAACDLRVAVDGKAQIGVPELVVGVPFPRSALEILRHATGGPEAARLIYTGERLSPRMAHELGFVTELAGGDEVLAPAIERARALGRLDKTSYGLAKAQLRRATLERIARYRADEDAVIARMWASSETMARLREYLESLQKRPR